MKRKSRSSRRAATFNALEVTHNVTNIAAALIVILGLFFKFGPALSPIPATTVLVPITSGFSIDIGSFLLVLGVGLLLVFSLVTVKRVRTRRR